MRFGPAGNSESFYAQGNKSTVQAPKWLNNMGLTAFEYSAGRGVSMGQATAEAIGQAAAEYDVRMSIHAPYFINCATVEPVKRMNTVRYFYESAQAVDRMGGNRVVFHPGSASKVDRKDALNTSIVLLKEVYARLADMNLSHIILCPETMGKKNQLGWLDEVLELCRTFDNMLPTIDFGHLHAINQGNIRSEEDFERIFDAVEAAIGAERASKMHCHFSKIEFTAAGEKKHCRFSDADYGPDYALLAEVLKKRGGEQVLICESDGTMAEDALTIKRMVEGDS